MESVSSKVAELAPFTETFSVSAPCIVNKGPIESGKEVILKLKPQQKDKRKSGSSEAIAFDQLVLNDKRRRRENANRAAE